MGFSKFTRRDYTLRKITVSVVSSDDLIFIRIATCDTRKLVQYIISCDTFA